MTDPREDVDLRGRVDRAVSRAFPTHIVTWPTEYDRRYGEVDPQERAEFTKRITDAILADLSAERVLPLIRERALRRAYGRIYEGLRWDDASEVGREATELALSADDVLAVIDSMATAGQLAYFGSSRAELGQ